MGQKETREMNSMWSNVSWVPARGCTILDLYRIDDILRIIRDPMTYNEEARALSRALYSSNGIITNVIDYMVALPVLNPVVVPHGDSAGKKRKNKQAVLDIWRSIRGDEVLRDGLHGTLLEGLYFAYFETIERPLPKDRSSGRLDGRQHHRDQRRQRERRRDLPEPGLYADRGDRGRYLPAGL